MSFAKKFSQVAIPTATAITLAFAANANATGLIPGQCYAKADAMAVLKQEGQFPIIMGNRLALSAKDKNANVFFINKQGYGYNIEGDTPVGVPAQKLCVRAAYKNAHLNSPDNSQIPSWGKNIKASSNGIDPVKAYQSGGRLIFAAQTYTPKADGAEVLGKSVVVMAGNIAGKTDTFGNVWSVDAAGYPDTSFDMEKMAITTQMTDLLNEKIASSMPAQPSLVLAAK